MADLRELKAAEKQAEDILKKLGIAAPPVPVKDIALKIGLKVVPYDLGEEVSGVLLIKHKAGTIGYNPRNSKVRQRFTIAHELGHFILHRNTGNEVFIDRDFIIKYRSDKKYSAEEVKQEQTANSFAASLLMPKYLIQKELENAEYAELGEIEFIERLARVFNVSVPAMSFRSANLDLMQW